MRHEQYLLYTLGQRPMTRIEIAEFLCRSWSQAHLLIQQLRDEKKVVIAATMGATALYVAADAGPEVAAIAAERYLAHKAEIKRRKNERNRKSHKGRGDVPRQRTVPATSRRGRPRLGPASVWELAR